MYALGFQKNKEVSVLIDLGTNGEMAIGNADKIYVTSTAAGPGISKVEILYAEPEVSPEQSAMWR